MIARGTRLSASLVGHEIVAVGRKSRPSRNGRGAVVRRAVPSLAVARVATVARTSEAADNIGAGGIIVTGVCLNSALVYVNTSRYCVGSGIPGEPGIAGARVSVAGASLATRRAVAAGRRCAGSVAVSARPLDARGFSVGGGGPGEPGIAGAGVPVAGASLAARRAVAAGRRGAASVCIRACLFLTARGRVGCFYCPAVDQACAVVCGEVEVPRWAIVGDIAGTISVSAGLCCGTARIGRQRYARSVSRSPCHCLPAVCLCDREDRADRHPPIHRN